MPREILGYAVDSSFWGGDLTRMKAQGIWADGFTEYMAACGPGSYGKETQRQLDDAVAVGFIPSAYAFFEWGNNPRAWMQQAAASLGPYEREIKRIALDIEDINNPVPANWRDVVDELFAEADRLFPQLSRFGLICNYMPIWYMKGYLHVGVNDDVTTWAGKRRALHNSWYDNDPDIDGLPFGGYTEDDVAVEQYGGTQDIGGMSVDVNAIYISALEDDMPDPRTDALIQELKELKVALFAGSERDSLSEPFDKRVEYANYRIGLGGQSLNDKVESLALAIAKTSGGLPAGPLTEARIAEIIDRAVADLDIVRVSR